MRAKTSGTSSGFGGRKAPPALLLVALVVLLPTVSASQGIGGSAAPTGVRLTGSAGVGFDSFQEKYSIVDRDTLDSVNEFRTRLSLGLAAGTFARDYFLLEGRVQYGDDTYVSGGRLKLAKSLWRGITRLGLEGDYARRQFGDNSSYQFANDYDRLFVRGHFKQSLGQSFALRLTDRFEYQNFEERTEFDYDYHRNRISLDGEFDWDITTLLNMGLSFVTMEIPDSTEIEYQAFGPTIEFRHFGGLYQRTVVQAALERRDYVAGSPRSSFWSVLAFLIAEWPFAPTLSVLLENDFEWYRYDYSDPVYFNYVENRTALLLKMNPSFNLSFGAGPTFGFLDSRVSTEDVYKEVGAKVALEYNRGAAVWVSFEYEPGKRTYKTFSDATQTVDDISLFSDYTYHRLSLFANVRVWDGLTFSSFLDFSPEDHKREGDDATATLISLSLTYFF
jgi:hypothetical protein